MQALLKATPLSKTRQPNPPDQSQMATSVVSPIHRLISMYDVFSCFVLNECLELCKDQSSLYVMHSLCQWVHAWSFSSSFQLELIPPRGGVSQCMVMVLSLSLVCFGHLVFWFFLLNLVLLVVPWGSSFIGPQLNIFHNADIKCDVPARY